MRWLAFAGTCAVVVSASASVAGAESRHTLAPVALRKKPGEHAAAVAQLPADTEVTVLAAEGRWLRVRARDAGSFVEGYVARTELTAPPSDGAAPSGQWSAARTASGRVVGDLYVEVVAARAVLRAEPRSDAAAVGELARGERLAVVDAAGDPAWIHARDRAGHDGWIARAQVGDGAAAVVIAGVDRRGDAAAARSAPGAVPVGRFAIRADLGIGFRTLGMDLTSNAEGGLANYALEAGAVAATLDLDAALRLGGALFAAADARASASASSPGIAYTGPTAPSGKIPFRTVAGDAGARIGARLHRAFDVALRAGVHYDAFLAAAVDNAGRLPRERLLGATLGARVDVAPAGSAFAVTARLDALVLGTRRQTQGLEDGSESTARALWGGLTLRYALGRRLAVFGGFDFGRASTRWTGMSVRQPGVTSTRRTDTAQLAQIGISTRL